MPQTLTGPATSTPTPITTPGALSLGTPPEVVVPPTDVVSVQSSPATAYRLLLADSQTGIIHAELRTDSFGYGEALNAPGAISVRMPIGQPKLDDGSPIVTATRLRSWRNSLWVLRDGVAMWGGPITSRGTQPDSQTIDLAGHGPHAYFRDRRFRPDTKSFTTDQLAIARQIIADAQAESGGDFRVDTTATNLSGVSRAITYTGSERKPYGEALDELAAMLDGFDFRYVPLYDETDGLRHRLSLIYPATGQDNGLTLEHGATCTVVGIDHDADRQANSWYATGAGEGVDMLIEEATVINGDPLLEGIVSATDITEIPLLEDLADRAVARHQDPQLRVTVQLVDGLGPQLGEFAVGDRMRVIYQDDVDTIDQLMRVLAWQVDVVGDAETITLEMGPLDPVHAPDPMSTQRELERRLAMLERARRATP